jgi:hypothetical protein
MFKSWIVLAFYWGILSWNCAFLTFYGCKDNFWRRDMGCSDVNVARRKLTRPLLRLATLSTAGGKEGKGRE